MCLHLCESLLARRKNIKLTCPLYTRRWFIWGETWHLQRESFCNPLVLMSSRIQQEVAVIKGENFFRCSHVYRNSWLWLVNKMEIPILKSLFSKHSEFCALLGRSMVFCYVEEIRTRGRGPGKRCCEEGMSSSQAVLSRSVHYRFYVLDERSDRKF